MYRMTPARKRALRKAQLASARKRRRTRIKNKIKQIASAPKRAYNTAKKIPGAVKQHRQNRKNMTKAQKKRINRQLRNALLPGIGRQIALHNAERLILPRMSSSQRVTYQAGKLAHMSDSYRKQYGKKKIKRKR